MWRGLLKLGELHHDVKLRAYPFFFFFRFSQHQRTKKEQRKTEQTDSIAKLKSMMLRVLFTHRNTLTSKCQTYKWCRWVNYIFSLSTTSRWETPSPSSPNGSEEGITSVLPSGNISRVPHRSIRPAGTGVLLLLASPEMLPHTHVCQHFWSATLLGQKPLMLKLSALTRAPSLEFPPVLEELGTALLPELLRYRKKDPESLLLQWILEKCESGSLNENSEFRFLQTMLMAYCLIHCSVISSLQHRPEASLIRVAKGYPL